MRRARTIAPLRPARMAGRTGFTLIELLVVISIIATLMSLLLPAIHNAKVLALMTQCKNRMRQVALAAQANATKQGGKIPAYGKFVGNAPLTGANPGNTFCDSVGGTVGSNWVVTCLAELGRQDIYDRFDESAAPASSVNLQMGQLHLPVLVCPADDTAVDRPGALSMVINAGYASRDVLDAYTAAVDAGNVPLQVEVHSHDISRFNWDGDSNTPGVADPEYLDDEDADVTRDTGVSWLEVDGKNFSHSMNSIYDGHDNTLFFSENLNAGWAGTWSNPAVSNCAFVYTLEPSLANGSSFPAPVAPADYDGRPNAMRSSGEGTPFPSSNHAGGVNVAMVSGSVKFLSDQIDRSVYVRLMTPQGSRIRGDIAGLVAQDPIDGGF